MEIGSAIKINGTVVNIKELGSNRAVCVRIDGRSGDVWVPVEAVEDTDE